MDKSEQINLVQLKQGKTGRVVALTGGSSFIKKLDALGIREGVRITKVSNMVMNGPVTVKVNGVNNVAIGRGMAEKIFVVTE